MNKMIADAANATEAAPTSGVLPDVAASDRSSIQATLDWVGMSEIALPFRLQDLDHGVIECQGRAQAYVNIARPDIKGIHMSRLYLLLEQWSDAVAVSPDSLNSFLGQKLGTHSGISDRASLSLRFDYLCRRPALKSDYAGWKAYPAEIEARLQDGKVETELKLSIPYSSTCPCSASLSRQLLAQALQEDFSDTASISKEAISQWLLSEKGSLATPHSQRSWAYIRVRLTDDFAADGFPLSRLIDQVEAALKTPVQTAVKREDEQEFARLNGANLMFCEDAARRVRSALLEQAFIHDFWLKIEHQESLHAHNAVAIATRGLADGYDPQLEF